MCDEENKESINKGRRRFLTAVTTIVGGVGAAYASVPFLGSWLPSARTQALGAPIKVDISKLEPGAQMTIEYRGMPIWIIRRTETVLSSLKSLEGKLRDPLSEENQQPQYAQNESRAIKPEFLVLVGICTHLGCVPTYRPDIGGVEPGWPGGFFCPCHGSKFDLAGRVFKGVPAPLNLEVPPYRYVSDTVIMVGEDQKAA